MTTKFVRLNLDWNADPNAPEPEVVRRGDHLLLTFGVNAFLFPQYAEGARMCVVFRNCWRYRLGPTNDEGWYMGQCRFSRLAPVWGEFYQVDGNLLLDAASEKWLTIGVPRPTSHHYLFYMKDATFECDATSVEVSLPLQSASV